MRGYWEGYRTFKDNNSRIGERDYRTKKSKGVCNWVRGGIISPATVKGHGVISGREKKGAVAYLSSSAGKTWAACRKGSCTDKALNKGVKKRGDRMIFRVYLSGGRRFYYVRSQKSSDDKKDETLTGGGRAQAEICLGKTF